MTTGRPGRWVHGADVARGDAIDTRPEFIVSSFTLLDSPLESITGPGRIAHNAAGASMAVYDKWPVRLLEVV